LSARGQDVRFLDRNIWRPHQRDVAEGTWLFCAAAEPSGLGGRRSGVALKCPVKQRVAAASVPQRPSQPASARKPVRWLRFAGPIVVRRHAQPGVMNAAEAAAIALWTQYNGRLTKSHPPVAPVARLLEDGKHPEAWV